MLGCPVASTHVSCVLQKDFNVLPLKKPRSTHPEPNWKHLKSSFKFQFSPNRRLKLNEKSNNLRKHLESVRLLEVNITLHMFKENHDIIVFQ